MTSKRKPHGTRLNAFKSNSAASTKRSYRRRNRMLSQAQRTAILELNTQQVSKREIARVLGISRVAVRKVLRSNSNAVPELHRTEKAEPHRQQILELFDQCKGNLVRVHEELLAGGAKLSYTALTAFCRRHGIGYAPPTPSGQYAFAPGEELQHDTSPHELELGGKKRKVQTASAVLCYSRMLFFQCYPNFRRFDCKVFLTEALRFMGGATTRVMIDNTHVVVLRGSGRDMVPVPEMAAFGERFGFQFVAHAIGNANRSGRVERPFHFIEHNFLAGRTFSSWEDLNQRAREWCDKVNSTYKKHIRAVPRELFAVERMHLKPLPVWIPEVYRLHQRLVDIEGYVALNSNRYSVPVDWIGRRVEVRETREKIEIQLDARRLVTHRRIAEAEHQRVMLAEHRPPRGHRDARPDPHPEEKAIVTAAPELADYVAGLKQRSRKVITLALRQLLRLVRAQFQARQEGALEWRIQRANLPERWSLETFPFARQPGVNRKQIRGLAELEFIAKAENIVLVGETARGKTGLACGLLLKALENGYRCQFIKAQNLFDEMYASLADRSTPRLLKRLARLDVLLIDELGYVNLKPEQSNIFFKLMEERYRQHSTIITTNLVYDEWPNFLGSRPMVEALLSRLRHYCHTVHIKGPSLREPQG